MGSSALSEQHRIAARLCDLYGEALTRIADGLWPGVELTAEIERLEARSGALLAERSRR